MNENTRAFLGFDITLFNGDNFNGNFSYNSSVITGDGVELARIEEDQGDFELTLDIFDQTLTAESDIDFGDGDPPFPFAQFEDGEIQGIDFLPPVDDVDVEGFGGFLILQSELIFVEDAYFEVAEQGLPPVPITDFNTELVGLVEYEGQTFNTIAGSERSDFLEGTREDDRIFAREGGDQVFARGGDDLVRAGDGSDIVFGASGSDTLTGNAGADLLSGGRGADDLQGGDGADLLQGGLGPDTLAGDEGRDTLIGGRDGDSLSGGNGADRLLGQAGNDTLTGGAGRDTLVGGGGTDQYTYDTEATFARSDIGRDVIQGFVSGQDTIVLSITTFNSLDSIAGNGFSVGADFDIVTDFEAASRSLGEVVYQSNTGDLYYNPNGATAGFGEGGLFANLTDNPGLSASDFVLV